MSTEKNSSGSPAVGIVVGAILMVAGTWVSTQFNAKTVSFLHSLEEQGLPLDPGKTVATIGVLMILFPVIKTFFLTPLTTAINERNADLERTFSEAEQLRTEMQQMRSSYEQQLASTQAEAREQIQSTIREAQNLRQTLMSEATERADALVERAQQEIAAERDKVVTELRIQVTDLALTAAEKVIGANMDTAANRRLVDDFINQVEVTR